MESRHLGGFHPGERWHGEVDKTQGWDPHLLLHLISMYQNAAYHKAFCLAERLAAPAVAIESIEVHFHRAEYEYVGG